MRYQRHKFDKTMAKRRIKVVIFVAVILFAVINVRVRPVLKEMTAVEAGYITNIAVNAAAEGVLSREDISYDDFITLNTLEDGTVSSMTSDIHEMNKFKTEISKEIQNKLADYCEREVSVPLGTLTGIDLLSGRGPRIKMKIELYGSVNTNLKSSFEDAGINQTRHRIICDVNVGVSAIIPGCSSYTDVESSFTVSETVLLGDVPSSYTNVDTSSGFFDDINNYIDD